MRYKSFFKSLWHCTTQECLSQGRGPSLGNVIKGVSVPMSLEGWEANFCRHFAPILQNYLQPKKRKFPLPKQTEMDFSPPAPALQNPIAFFFIISLELWSHSVLASFSYFKSFEWGLLCLLNFAQCNFHLDRREQKYGIRLVNFSPRYPVFQSTIWIFPSSSSIYALKLFQVF